MFKKKKVDKKKEVEEPVVDNDVINTTSKTEVKVEDDDGSMQLDVDEQNLVAKRLQESEDIALYLKVQRGAAEYKLLTELVESLK